MDTPIVIVTTNAAAPAVRARTTVDVQNVGTAICGVHVGDTQPTSLDECEVILPAASALDDGDGGFVELHPAGPVWLFFAASGDKKAKVSEVL